MTDETGLLIETAKNWLSLHDRDRHRYVGRLVDKLKAALEAQVAVNVRLMTKAGLSEADIADCTSQARAALSPTPVRAPEER